MLIKLLELFSVFAMTVVIIIQAYLSFSLLMLYDSPDAGYKPLKIIVPWFVLMICLIAFDIYLMWTFS